MRAAGLFAFFMVLFATPAAAQTFKPTRPVELVVHTGPGGGSDVFARVIASIIEKERLLPVRVNILNKPGGGGAVAMSYLAERKAEPHTIALYTTLWMTLGLTSAEARVHFTDLTPVVNLVFEPDLVVVKNDAPFARSPISSTPRRKTRSN